jgi:hypothetical protein
MGSPELAGAKVMRTEAASNRNLEASNVRGSIELTISQLRCDRLVQTGGYFSRKGATGDDGTVD